MNPSRAGSQALAAIPVTTLMVTADSQYWRIVCVNTRHLVVRRAIATEGFRERNHLDELGD